MRDGRTDWRTDRRTESNQYIPHQLRCEGYNNFIRNKYYQQVKMLVILMWPFLLGIYGKFIHLRLSTQSGNDRASTTEIWNKSHSKHLSCIAIPSLSCSRNWNGYNIIPTVNRVNDSFSLVHICLVLSAAVISRWHCKLKAKKKTVRLNITPIFSAYAVFKM